MENTTTSSVAPQLSPEQAKEKTDSYPTEEKCYHPDCETKVFSICVDCKKHFCLVHTSEIDPKFCQECLSLEKPSLEEKPLVDEEGVEHQGRHLVPTGDIYKTLAKALSEMTQAELRDHISYCKTKVKELELGTYHHKISQNSAEMELEQREGIETRRARALRGVSASGKITIGGVNVGKKESNITQDKAHDIVAALKAQGISIEQVEAALRMAQKRKI